MAAVASEVLDLFLELAAIASPSGEERAVADRVLALPARPAACEPDEDDTGAEVGSTMGNIYVALEPTAAGEPLFFCAHLDTVPPVDPIEPVVEDGSYATATERSSAATTRRPSPRCWRRPAGYSPRIVRTPASSSSSPPRRRSA